VGKQFFNFSFFAGILAGIFLSGIVLTIINNIRIEKLFINNQSIRPRITYTSTEVSPETCKDNYPSLDVRTTQPTNGINKGKIDINSASVVELESLPGIGPEKANAIVQFRGDYGLFLSIDELNYVPGISEKMIEQFRDLVMVCPVP
jgi:competence ComEA-like helix-hairpin-helix protein